MYIPRPFTVDPGEARELLSQVSAGHLVTATDSGPLATLMPWFVDFDANALVGHMARSNVQWRTPWHGEALVIFEGPNAYVSPSWYSSKAEHGRVVPTWNYVVMHVCGRLTINEEQAWIDDVVRRLTAQFEQHRPEPWSVDDAPAEYIEGQLKGIVGIELRIDRLEVSMKMSQNKSDADISGVIAGLAGDGSDAVAEIMRRSMP